MVIYPIHYAMTNEAIPNLTAFDEASIEQAFAALTAQARAAAEAIDGEPAQEAFRLEWLGRKQGRLNDVSGRWLKAAPPEAKKTLGQRFNELKKTVEALLDTATGAGPSDAALAAESIDITLPGTRRLVGAEHPITKTLNEIVSVFAALGYSVGVGPEVETDFYNFESMNFPPGPSCARHAGHAGGGWPGEAQSTRPVAAAHAHLARADADHGATAAAGADRDSRQGAPQRRG
jgi:phenylalanyl-tRNA synthetase alpha chain